MIKITRSLVLSSLLLSIPQIVSAVDDYNKKEIKNYQKKVIPQKHKYHKERTDRGKYMREEHEEQWGKSQKLKKEHTKQKNWTRSKRKKY